MSDDLEMREGALAQAAREAGLVDQDLLKLVKPGIKAADAVADLRTRFPRAFGPIFNGTPVPLHKHMSRWSEAEAVAYAHYMRMSETYVTAAVRDAARQKRERS